MLQWIFGGMTAFALLWGMTNGVGELTAGTMLKAAEEAVQTAIALAGAYAFFCGMMNIVRKAGAAESKKQKFSRLNYYFNNQSFDNSGNEKKLEFMDL